MRPSLLREFPSSASNRQVTKAGHPKQYLTHAHSHISWAVTAMDSCLALISAHQHGIQLITRTPVPSKPCSKALYLVYSCSRVQSKDGLYFTDKAQISGQRSLIAPRNATRLSLAIHCFGTGVLIWRLVAQHSRKTTFQRQNTEQLQCLQVGRKLFILNLQQNSKNNTLKKSAKYCYSITIQSS